MSKNKKVQVNVNSDIAIEDELILQASKTIPIKELNAKKDIEDFFDKD
ncbi:hypothetical protein [Lactobacillus pasteurii]|uniref:Uncharacterized protein n=1 Tax=Lactobacillus pasteurii DSM 23907 = CRBIP 24.76 TaxID=1423790 RepID=I7J072_9LACO|nr:hypothetical protein [Lactobacillus pasteurii]TDG77526.1 hypothetical protein C5L33_000969 [Lactobacillus pasteurii]CCI85512.1 Protein of unknown function [Lactobacillus pasteurii DSM 23907 = CRBIP 24.76]